MNDQIMNHPSQIPLGQDVKRQTTPERPPFSPISPSVPSVTRQSIPGSPRFPDSMLQSRLENRHKLRIPHLGAIENELWAPEFQSLRQSTSLALPLLHENLMDDTDDPWGLPRALQTPQEVEDNAALEPLVGFLGERLDNWEDSRFLKTPVGDPILEFAGGGMAADHTSPGPVSASRYSPSQYFGSFDTLPDLSYQPRRPIPATALQAIAQSGVSFENTTFQSAPFQEPTFQPTTSRYDTFPPAFPSTFQPATFQPMIYQPPALQPTTVQPPTVQPAAPHQANRLLRQLTPRNTQYGDNRRQRAPRRVIQADGTVGRKMRPATHWSTAKYLEKHVKAILLETTRPTTKFPERYMCYMRGCGVSANDKAEIGRHWTGSTPAIHGTAVYERWKVFGVRYPDWLLDDQLLCTLNATDRDEWKRDWQTRHGYACETELVDSGVIQ